MTRDPGALFLLVLFPMILTLVFGLSFGKIGGGEENKYTLALVNEGDMGDKWVGFFQSNLSETGLFEIENYEQENSARSELEQGRIDSIVVLPQGFGEACESFRRAPEDPSSWSNVTLGLYVDSGSLVASQAIPPLIESMIELILIGDVIDEPRIPVNLGAPSMIEGRETSTFDYFVPGLFSYAAIFLIMSVGQSFTIDRENGLLRRIRTTPTSSIEFMSGHALSNMVVAIIQVTVIFAMAFVIGYRPLGGVPALLMAFLTVIIFSLCCVGFGLITATLAKSPGSATGIAFVFILPQMFLGTFVGLVLSPAMKRIARLVPS